MSLVLGESAAELVRTSENGAEPSAPAEVAAGYIEIGLLNNMPDSAIHATERQFIRVLGAAAGPLRVRLHFFSLPEIARGPAMRPHLETLYTPFSALGRAPLDGLIVTGSEPIAANLAEEPYWDSFTRVVDWAAQHTVSTVWSCLAAHAAVLRLGNVRRQRLPEKRFGVFTVERSADHPLVAGLDLRWPVPHSRWNDLREGDLATAGYRVLARSPAAGVDLFVRPGRSLFVFLQGHPEYDPDTLFREYRRDVGRFLQGERADYPQLPAGYFAPEAELCFERLAERGKQTRDPGLSAELLDRSMAAAFAPKTTWQDAAVGLYRNWLAYIAARKAEGTAGIGSRS
jgi:homoserine O-succinyltransferase